MKRRDFILMALASLTSCRKKAKLSAIPPDSLVMAFGDSVTFGTGAGAGEDWPTLLAGLTGWKIINAGIPGDTAEAGRTRLQGLLDEHKPVLVIIEIGGNDFLRRRPPDAVKQDLKALTGTVRRSGAQVVLIGVPELSLLALVAGKPGDSPIYDELGKEEGVPVIAKVFSDVLSQPALCADKIHPNAQGYQQMATGIHSGLKRHGLVAE